MPLAIMFAALTGCAAKPDPIPRYPLADKAASLSIVRDRLAAIKTVRGEATIVLTDAKGQRVSLDGAYVLAPPGRARLRAWKFGQAVFDLTIDGDKAWAYLPRADAKPAAPGLRESVGRWLGLLAGHDPIFDTPDGLVDDKQIEIARQYAKGAMLYCFIDRATLTPRRYAVGVYPHFDFDMMLSDYRTVGPGQIWPMTIRAVSASGTVEVRTSDVELSADLPDAAFKPPARAEALP